MSIYRFLAQVPGRVNLFGDIKESRLFAQGSDCKPPPYIRAISFSGRPGKGAPNETYRPQAYQRTTGETASAPLAFVKVSGLRDVAGQRNHQGISVEGAEWRLAGWRRLFK